MSSALSATQYIEDRLFCELNLVLLTLRLFSKMRQFQVIKKNLTMGKFTNEEDRIILQAVKDGVPCRWSQIALLVPGRVGKQLRERFMNHIDPSLKTTQWIEIEDDILMEATKIFGTSWKNIAKILYGRYVLI